MCVHLNILRVTSVKTQLILLSIINVATCFDSQSYHQANFLNRFVFMVPCIADKIYLIVVQRDATQSSLFIILQVNSTCFGCQPHSPTPIIIIRSTQNCNYNLRYLSYFFVQLPHSNVAKIGHVGGRQLHSTGGCSYSFVYC